MTGYRSRVIGQKVLVVRWLLLCTLAFGLVGMHHLASTSHHGGEHVEATVAAEHVTPTITQAVTAADCCDDHGAGDGHDILHLCLVILAAGLVIVVLLARWRRSGPDASLLRQFSPASRQPPSRASPGPTAVLASLGVLRL